MPELPDVETFKRTLDATSLHQRIRGVTVEDARVLDGVTAADLGRALEGRAFERSRRHGKLLFADAGDLWVVFHFGMTGLLRYEREGGGGGGHERVVFHFASRRQLAFDCQRMFGRVGLAGDPGALIRDRSLGPDALSLGRDDLAAILGARRTAVKSVLMDQRALAGIGNVYSDEILLQAGIHPETGADRLDRREVGRLYTTARRVLERAIAAGADPARMPRGWLTPRRDEARACPRCGGRIERRKIGGRTAYMCPACQKRES